MLTRDQILKTPENLLGPRHQILRRLLLQGLEPGTKAYENARAADWRKRNPECVKLAQKKWRERQPEGFQKERVAAWRASKKTTLT